METIIGKVSKTCGILNKLKYRLPQSILLNIYNTLILPYLQYCAIVLDNCNHSKLNSLFIIQKCAVRNIRKLKYLTHTHYVTLGNWTQLLRIDYSRHIALVSTVVKFGI